MKIINKIRIIKQRAAVICIKFNDVKIQCLKWFKIGFVALRLHYHFIINNTLTNN